jgi:hypothetical protein
MLGRKTYTQEELDHAKTATNQQLAAYKKLVKAIDSATADPKVTSALEAFEPLFFNNMTLPRPLLRPQTAHGVPRGNNVVKLIPEESVVKLNIGDRIKLTATQFDRLSKAFFAELEGKFL